MEIVQHSSGVWYRPAAGEEHILKEQSFYSPLDLKNRTVFDIGANIGSFARKAIVAGAKKIYCYEPFLETFSVLKKNTVEGMETFPFALVGDDRKTSEFYLSKRFPAAHTTIPKRGREKVTIECRNFYEELEKYKPSVLKIDCEGTEYEFFNKEVPDYVDEIGMELHLNMPDGQFKAFELAHKFREWNYYKRFRFNWTTTMLIISRNNPGMGKVGGLLQENALWNTFKDRLTVCK